MSGCIFCAIAAGEADADVVAEGDSWVAFRDLDPAAPSHVLIVPRRHVTSVDDLGVDDVGMAGELMLACREVATRERLKDGYRVLTNVGSDGGQAVHHLHIHVLGGRPMEWPPG